MDILVIGSGGREHCLVWKLNQSKQVKKIYCAPGNGGTALIAENIAINAEDIDTLLRFALDKKIDLTVVGPEAPLVKGIVDLFSQQGLKIFGPDKELAMLEGSKVFAKEQMRKFGIPTADFQVFTDPLTAKKYINQKGVPLVVKADGLAAGKGVIVAKTVEEACAAVDLMLVKKEFGSAGDKIIIEDCLAGEEASLLAITDGKTILPLVSAQDHKRVFDNDQGPNTGGMGAYAPAAVVTDELLVKVQTCVFKPLIKGLARQGKFYKGVIYAGIMINNNDINVLEFNVRFGDPETQAILPKLKNDLAQIMLQAAEGGLAGIKLEFYDMFCLNVVLAAGGYPGSYEKGVVITGLESLKDKNDVFVFHAGTAVKSGQTCCCCREIITNGGRVLSVASLGNTLEQARKKVYNAISAIHFDNMHFRKDIGNRGLALQK